MTDRYIVAGVFPFVERPFYKKPFPRVRVSVSADPVKSVKYWLDRYGDFVIVVAHKTDADLDYIRHALAIPEQCDIDTAALLLGRLSISTKAMPTILSSIRRTGERSVPLLHEWFTAVAITHPLSTGLSAGVDSEATGIDSR